MSTRKVSVTLPEELLDRAKSTAVAEGVSFSALVAEGLESMELHREGLEAVREFEAEEGELGKADRASARELLARANAHVLRQEAQAS